MYNKFKLFCQIHDLQIGNWITLLFGISLKPGWDGRVALSNVSLILCIRYQLLVEISRVFIRFSLFCSITASMVSSMVLSYVSATANSQLTWSCGGCGQTLSVPTANCPKESMGMVSNEECDMSLVLQMTLRLNTHCELQPQQQLLKSIKRCKYLQIKLS